MNINQLEYFISVAETLNFTKAAERCYISQTAISQQIKALEDTVGVRLLERDKHHVKLTPAGEAYLKEVKDITRRNNEAVRLARSVSEGVSGTLNIGFIKGFIYEGVADIVRAFRNAYPRVNLTFCTDNMNGLYDTLDNGRCDIVFNLAQSIGKSHRAFNHKHLSSYPLTVTLPKGHRLSDRASINYPELEGESFIIMQPSDRPKDDAEEVLVSYERGGFIPNIVASEKEPEILLLMVSSGIGISVLPEYIIRNHSLGRTLSVVPIVRDNGTPEMLEIEACWKADNVNPATQKFMEIIDDFQSRDTSL